jgi:hypothetical protein
VAGCYEPGNELPSFMKCVGGGGGSLPDEVR